MYQIINSSGLQNSITAVIPQEQEKVYQVPQAINQLDGCIASLHSGLAQLEKRLQTVSSIEPSDQGKPETVASSRTVHEKLFQQAQSVEIANRTVERILRLLEV